MNLHGLSVTRDYKGVAGSPKKISITKNHEHISPPILNKNQGKSHNIFIIIGGFCTLTKRFHSENMFVSTLNWPTSHANSRSTRSGAQYGWWKKTAHQDVQWKKGASPPISSPIISVIFEKSHLAQACFLFLTMNTLITIYGNLWDLRHRWLV